MSGLARDNWDWNPSGDAGPAPTTTNNEFRRSEIRAMNAEAERAQKMTAWGLVGLFAVVIIGYISATNRRS